MAVQAGLSRKLIEMVTKAMQAEDCTPEQVESVLDRMLAQIKEMAEGMEFLPIYGEDDSLTGYKTIIRSTERESP